MNRKPAEEAGRGRAAIKATDELGCDCNLQREPRAHLLIKRGEVRRRIALSHLGESAFTSRVSPSAAKRKASGDSGHPWGMPQCIVKGLLRLPFAFIHRVGSASVLVRIRSDCLSSLGRNLAALRRPRGVHRRLELPPWGCCHPPWG
eukprot:scaffold35257_cov28-Tisochrysis_lutea.AAC.3